MNNDELIKFTETIIVEHTQDQPAAWLLDSLGYRHINERCRDMYSASLRNLVTAHISCIVITLTRKQRSFLFRRYLYHLICIDSIS